MPVMLRTWLRRDSERAGLREEAAAPALRAEGVRLRASARSESAD